MNNIDEVFRILKRTTFEETHKSLPLSSCIDDIKKFIESKGWIYEEFEQEFYKKYKGSLYWHRHRPKKYRN